MATSTETVKSGFLTLIGLPNAGKSTLLNALVGESLAIVTPKAQTTWQCLRGHVERDGLEMVVTDTPGLQEGTKALNAALAKNAAMAVSLAKEGARTGHEMVCLVVDAAEVGRNLSNKTEPQANAIARVLERDCGKLPLHLPVIVALNKADLVRKEEYRKEIEQAVTALANKTFTNVLAVTWVSSQTKNGLDAWLGAIMKALPEGQKGELFEADTMSDQNLREFVSEFIREQCFMQLGAELPYSIAVFVDTFDEKDPAITRIEATLHLERDSQKLIVIGKGGTKLKAIGTKAREKIEKLLGKKVYLGLRVKVTPHWAREAQWVERFGYAASRK